MSKLLEQAINEGSSFIDEQELGGFSKEAYKFGYIVIVNSFFDGVASVQLWNED